MNILLLITGFSLLFFLFPQECAGWLHALLAPFDRRAQQQAAADTACQTTVAAMNEWAGWITRFTKAQQPGGRGGPPRLLMTQVLAAGERFLQAINRQQFPALYHETEVICRQLRERLHTKKGARLAKQSDPW